MKLFYTPDIATDNALPEEEAKHAVKVLRLSEGDEITLMDGKGSFYDAEISLISGKRCEVRILQERPWQKPWQGCLHIAVSPTKNMDRMEWFVEKAVEMGIDRITFLACEHSERKVVKTDRIQKIVVSAAKQSLKGTLPVVDEMMPFNEFLKRCKAGRRFIAHCYDTEKRLLRNELVPGEDTVVLIGPEGDFSMAEVEAASAAGFVPVSLGECRLRTETAAMMSCAAMALANQK